MSWIAMRARCLNTNSDKYQLCGGRGITVCDRWRDSFDNFLADMGERQAGTTLDRKDSNGNYDPDNCRWATIAEQSANRRTDGLGWRRHNTHCPSGHPFDDKNTRIAKDGSRKCRACERAQAQRRRDAAKAATTT